MALIRDESTGKPSFPMPPISAGAFSTSPAPGTKPVVENAISGRKISSFQRYLYWAARDAARTALHLYTSERSFDRVNGAISAGGAVEYLMRSLISTYDPSLLADRGNLASVVALSRAITPTPPTAQALRTITFTQALDILNKIHPSLNITSEVNTVMNTRNAAAHMAMESSTDLAESVVKMVTVVSALHAFFDEPEAQFWGEPLLKLVTAMKLDYENAIKIRVQGKIAHALTELEIILAGTDATNREETLLVLERREVAWMSGDDSEDEPRECPACHRRGTLTIIRERQMSDYVIVTDDDEDMSGSYALVSVTGIPSMFQCPVCNLRLEGNELDQFPELSNQVEYEADVVEDLSEVLGGWDE